MDVRDQPLPLKKNWHSLKCFPLTPPPQSHPHLHGQPRSPAPPCWRWSGCTWRAGGCGGPPCPGGAGSLWRAPCVRSPRWTHTGGPGPSPCSPGSPRWCWWCSPRWPACNQNPPAEREGSGLNIIETHTVGLHPVICNTIHNLWTNGLLINTYVYLLHSKCEGQQSVNDPLTSSLSMLDRKFIMTLCFLGYFWHRALMACTTTTWNHKHQGQVRDKYNNNNRIQKR